MATYLSLDLDFFDRTDSLGNILLLREILANMHRRGLPFKVVMSHERLVPHIKELTRIKFDCLINMDEHSDACGWRKSREHPNEFRPGAMDCGNWVDHVPFAKGGTYIWYTPPKSSGCDCAEETFSGGGGARAVRWIWRKWLERNWGESYIKTKHKLSWRKIGAGGLAMSPDYTSKAQYKILKRVVKEYYPLPTNCLDVERMYGIRED